MPPIPEDSKLPQLHLGSIRNALKNRNFFLLWIGQIISQIGDRLDQMALIAYIYLRYPGSSLEIAKMLSFTILPVFLIGPLAGVYVDRWDRRTTMYSCDLMRSLMVLCIPLFLFKIHSLIWLYLFIFLIFSIGRFFIPAKLAIIPDLVDKKDLLVANSLVNCTGMIAAILGFGISGILVEWLGAKGGFYLDAFSFFISGLMIFLISKKAAKAPSLTTVGKQIVDVFRKSVFQEIKDGMLYFVRERSLRFTGLVVFMLACAIGSLYVVLIVFVQKTLHSATKDLGLLIMFLGMGLLVGSLFYGRFGQRLSPYKIIFASLLVSGLIIIAFALSIYNYPYFHIAASLSLVLGLVVAPIMTAANTIIHSVSDNRMMGKIFSSLEIIMHIGFLLFMFLGSRLAERIPHIYIIVTTGTFISLAGLACLLFVRDFPRITGYEQEKA